MDAQSLPPSNFAFLQANNPQLMRLGMLAEQYFAADPNTSLLKQRQFAELLTQSVAANVGLAALPNENQYSLLRELQDRGILPRDVCDLLHAVRKAGNDANHALAGDALVADHSAALRSLKLVWQLGGWYHRTFVNKQFKTGAFIPPQPPKDESVALRTELERLNQQLADYQATHQQTTQQLENTAAKLKTVQEERQFWEQMAQEAEQARVGLQTSLAEQRAQTPQQAVAEVMAAATEAAQDIVLDEADTRQIIDAQLRTAGWLVDSRTLRYSAGTRPQRGKNMAIAEWPTGSGPADYVLFVGLTPIATVEAKRQNIDVSAALQQAQRYSRDHIEGMGGETLAEGAPWDKFKVPFAFSSNGRPYLRQLATKSGTWFRDLRRDTNLARPLDGWYTPDGLSELLKQDAPTAHEKLKQETFDFGFEVRDYQRTAILKVEEGIANGQRALLLAMATGTGKTKTCIALIYRLLKTRRFRRVLFLVDRSALGEQAANAFGDTRMESLQTFADTFRVMSIDETTPDSATAVQVATIQGMVRRILLAEEGQPVPAVDQYDCIIVDECHRGYLLDRELSSTELGFRDFADYISKYRRVLDYFDAVKIGLTATPAPHTTDIFGLPVFTYSYREAVVDGYLVDYEPPFQIKTTLNEGGIHFASGEQVQVYNTRTNQIELFKTPDQIDLEIESFNTRVMTEPFNKVVCEYLARELDPNSPQKTLIFCASDAHADMVVALLKAAFASQYGEVSDDAVVKITGKADKPLELIRRYKNERNPNVAVTVDLLTTGIDVPDICNLVFLRRVNSRILYEQMLGRATRLSPDIGKQTFRVFDAVQLYEGLQKFSNMKPVVVNPNATFAQLADEIRDVLTDDARELARDEFIVKLRHKQRHLSERAEQDFETKVGMRPDEFIQTLHTMPLSEIAAWFTQHNDFAEILDRKGDGAPPVVYISQHADNVTGVQRGYSRDGKAERPEDYLHAFGEFVRNAGDQLPALLLVTTRPRELTRKDLRNLAMVLDRAGFGETRLATAWREAKNEDIAAGVMGFIRQAALGERLIPYEQRVDRALQKLLAAHHWSNPQREWLRKIAAQTKVEDIVDREALDDPNQLFRRDGGGFTRLDRIFEGRLAELLAQFNDEIWTT